MIIIANTRFTEIVAVESGELRQQTRSTPLDREYGTRRRLSEEAGCSAARSG
jgi:hypothetical protein